MNSVTLEQLTIGYLVRKQQKIVCGNMSAVIHGGELTCLLGRNGAGKSTLLRTLAAFQPPLSGDVLLSSAAGSSSGDALSLRGLSDQKRSRLISVVLTEKPDIRNMTVDEMVQMGRSPYTGFWGSLTDGDYQVVDEAIRLTGIESLRNRMIHTLSDGERQKVMIAKALAQQTPIIYLDEPTAFLDFPSKVETMQLLRRLAAGQHKTVFLSTHDVELALQVADRVWLMEPDHLFVGTPQELAAQGVLARFIEREGITFDSDSLTIRISRETSETLC